MTDLASTLLLLALAAGALALWWYRRRRAEQLVLELAPALALAVEAQQVHWRLERRYTPDLAELGRLRRRLAPFVDGSRHGDRTRWELQASDNGSGFELAVLAVPVRRLLPLPGRSRTLGYLRLLTARGDHGTIAYDTLAGERPRPSRARRLAPVGR